MEVLVSVLAAFIISLASLTLLFSVEE